ncbi:phage portal protein [Virgibacillus halodenitrificans]|uniref:phage tail tube protein n=1 Tax=Virgibacillus halodenitrificans TaxID=1482 RepID=UPI00136A0F65|nr:phage tail tube protein [Virgibacillus halodenitrificans]MYL45056.1 phage portal protein [Virgibacillus halodenitrificans]
MGLDAERVINGSFGELWEDGEWQENINSLVADVNIQKSALKTSGTRWDKHKVIGVDGTGTASGFKVTSKMIQKNSWVMGDRGVPAKTELISKLDDPEAYGHERIRLKNVKWDSINLANWTAGEEVTQETPFTFEGFELLDPIEA